MDFIHFVKSIRHLANSEPLRKLRVLAHTLISFRHGGLASRKIKEINKEKSPPCLSDGRDSMEMQGDKSMNIPWSPQALQLLLSGVPHPRTGLWRGARRMALPAIFLLVEAYLQFQTK